MVDTISHSKYWKQSAIFVVEDDTQNGVDHVDGMRAPVEIISPYAKRGVVDDHFYNQLTVLRTTEQMLGMQPSNERDTAATPMYDAFTSKPNFTPLHRAAQQHPADLRTDHAAQLRLRPGAGPVRDLVSGNVPTIPASEEKTAAL